MPEAVAATRPRVTGDPVVGVCPSPIAPCAQILIDTSTDLLLQNVQDPDGTPITGATVTVSIFDVDDLVTALVGPFNMVDDTGGDYSQNFKPGVLSGFFVGQRVQIVYDFNGPGAGDDRIFNLIALVCDG